MGALLVLGACRERAPAVKQHAVAAPPRAPADLMFEGVLAEPEAFHHALGTALAPAAAALAPRWEAAAVALMDLPRGVGERLDPKGPALVVGLASKAGLKLVLAARVLSGEEIVALLTQGNAPPRRAERRPDGVVLLAPVESGRAGSALAVVDRFVLASSDAGALERSAAYMARSLALGAVAPGVRLTVPKPALAGAFGALIDERWSQARAELERGATELALSRGRSADFAEPAAVLQLADGVVRTLLDVLASSRALSLSARALDERLELTLELEPEATGAALTYANALRPGTLDALAALPAQSTLALAWRPAPASERAAAESADALRAVFGPRLSPRDAERASSWFVKTQREPPAARAFSLLADRTLVYREELAPGAPGTDLAAAIALLELPAFGEPFARLFGKPSRALPSASASDSESRLERRALADASHPGELVWSAGSLEPTLAIGPSARTVVETASRAADDKTRLGLSTEVRARHEPAAFALHVELSRLGMAPASAPVLLSLTRRARAISLRLELSRGASQALLQRIFRR